MFINCVAYEGGKKLADIPPSEIHSYVCKPECFVWVALFEPSREELILVKTQSYGRSVLGHRRSMGWAGSAVMFNTAQ